MPGELVILRRWWNARAFAGAAVTALCSAFPLLAVFASTSLLWFVAPFAILGACYAYWCVALYFNTTTLRLGPDTLTVRHGPIPWPSPRDLATHSVRRLFVRENEKSYEGATNITWEVHVDYGLERLAILKGLSDKAEAEYIAWALDDHLAALRGLAMIGG